MDTAIELAEDLYVAGKSDVAINLLNLGRHHFSTSIHDEYRFQLAMGNLHGHLGSWHRSTQHLESALSIAKTQGNLQGALSAVVSITGNSTVAGRYKVSARHLAAAAPYLSCASPVLLSALRANEALMHSLSGDPRQGLRAIRQSREYIDQIDTRTRAGQYRVAVIDNIDVRLRVNLKDYDGAYELARSAQARSGQNSDLSSVWTNTAYGLANVSVGNLAHGYALLEDAMKNTSGLNGAQESLRETLVFSHVLARRFDSALSGLSSMISDSGRVPRLKSSAVRASSGIRGIQDRNSVFLRLANQVASEKLYVGRSLETRGRRSPHVLR